jgi:SPP1 gp7 family putative phage head morphogenesis protein
MPSSKDYWQVRLQDKIYNKQTKLIKRRLTQVYREAEQQVNIQLTDLYMDILSAGEEVTANMLYQQNRYKKLQDLINEQIVKLGKTEEKEIAKSLLTVYKQVYEQTAKKITADFTWTFLNEHNAKQIVYANFKGANFSQRIWENKSRLRAQIEKSVIDSVVVGNSKDRAVKEIRQRFGVGFNDADRIVRTEVQRVLNDGQRQTYKDRGYSQVKWITADDDRLCDECEPLDNKVFDIDDAPSVVHPNCRCTFIPVLDKELFK